MSSHTAIQNVNFFAELHVTLLIYRLLSDFVYGLFDTEIEKASSLFVIFIIV